LVGINKVPRQYGGFIKWGVKHIERELVVPIQERGGVWRYGCLERSGRLLKELF
jgi:hypothetical protein